MCPGVAAPTIRGSTEFLKGRADVRRGKVALIGFSFGAPQVAMAAACGELSAEVAGVVLFGSYCSLGRTIACQFTGHHEWDGAEYELTPDPYGRWVLGSNHLTDVPDHRDADDVADALRQLAFAASGQRIPAWDPHHDEMIEPLRETLPPKRRRLFDLFATPSGAVRPERAELFELAAGIADACRRVEPLLEVETDFARIRRPTRLIHGRGDRLIPFTEGMRLEARLPEAVGSTLTVTGLFSHSADRSAGSAYERAKEGLTFFEALRGVINTV
jgi:pimeloyl-ACP methyl ester carboxylesterase